jgi:hypothetical protein
MCYAPVAITSPKIYIRKEWCNQEELECKISLKKGILEILYRLMTRRARLMPVAITILLETVYTAHAALILTVTGGSP